MAEKDTVEPTLEQQMADPATGQTGPAKPNAEREDGKDVVTDDAADKQDDVEPVVGDGEGDAGGTDEAGDGDDASGGTDDEPSDDGAADDADAASYDTAVWGSTGTEVGDSVLELLSSAEITPADAKALMYDAVVAGDVTQIDQAALIEKIGKAKATLVMAGVKDFVAEKVAKEKSITDAVYGEAGGKENWEKVREWSKDKLTDEQRTEYNDMFNSGGAKARFAAQEMIQQYNKNSKASSVGKTRTIKGDGQAKPNVTPITKREYAEQMEVAHRKGDKSAIAKIQLARVAGRKAGI